LLSSMIIHALNVIILTDEQMPRIVIDEYLSQQVFEPSLIAKYSSNSLLSSEEITQCYSNLGAIHL
jgi:hypothetical protein